MSAYRLMLVTLILICVSVSGCGDSANKPAFVVDQSSAKQAERMSLIEQLSDENVFPKITFADNGVLIWVGSAFQTLDEQTKRAYVKEIHAYGYREDKGLFPARLKDLKTGSAIGEFHPDTGLALK